MISNKQYIKTNQEYSSIYFKIKYLRFMAEITEEKEVWKVYKIVRRFNQYKELNPNIWEVSNFGRVKKNGILYECRKSGSGYLMFSCYYVHKIVAQLFIQNPNNYNEVDHIDGNKINNFYLNLRWCSHKQNCNNPITRKRSSESKKGVFAGENHPMYNKHHTTETKIKISKACKKSNAGEKNGFYGKTHTQEFKNKMSAWHKTHKKVLCEDGKYHYKDILDK